MYITQAQEEPIQPLIHRLWHWLTEPSAAVTEFETQLKSRWMAAMFVVLVPFGFMLVMVPPLVDGRPPWEDPQVQVAVGLFSFLSICYYLARQGHYKVSAVIAVGAASLTIYSISVIDHDPGNLVSDATYLIATLIFSSIMLSQRSTAALLVINVLGLLLQPLLAPAVSMEDIVKGPLSLLVMTFALVAFGAYLRTALEKHHIDALRVEIAERRQAEARLAASLQEKEILLKEIHHRVKNNLQIISSLLNLQSSVTNAPLALAELQDSQSRIRSMALIHERLYRSDTLTYVDLREYLRDLASSLIQTYHRNAQSINLHVEVGTILLDIDTAMPCGLLVNELVSNAFKHAFPSGNQGEIGVEAHLADDSQYQLVVWDNGVGFPPEKNFLTPSSLGLQLVHSLAQQLNGTVELHSPPGTKIVICFPKTSPDRIPNRRT